ncbi:MAG: nucleotide exchange factor GrpE [Actinomycetota bacterium]
MAPGEEDLTPDLVDDVAAPDFGADPAVMGDPAVAAEAQVELVEHDLVDLVAKAGERDEYLDLAQRTQADFENFRKRSTKEMRAAEGRGVAKLARELLPAVDNLTLALAAIVEAGGDPGVLNGLKLVHDELLAALARVGIEPFSPQGELFDPVQHEAMAQQVVEGAPAGTVVEVYQRGYRIGEMVLRPARVVVAA